MKDPQGGISRKNKEKKKKLPLGGAAAIMGMKKPFGLL